MTRKRQTWMERWSSSVAACIAAGLEGGKLVRFCCKAGPSRVAVGYWPRRTWVREVKRQLGVARRRRAADESYPLFEGIEP